MTVNIKDYSRTIIRLKEEEKFVFSQHVFLVVTWGKYLCNVLNNNFKKIMCEYMF